VGVFSEKIHRNIYSLGLLLLACALPVSVFLMSVAQFVLIINWVLEGNVPQKLRNYMRNKTALIFSLIFFLHIFGLIYTSDFNYALKDIKTKIPLLLLPLVVSTSVPLMKFEWERIRFFFIASVFVATVISTVYLKFFEFNDIRQISLFISHIRFSLLIVIAIILLFDYIFKSFISIRGMTYVAGVILMWLVFFLFLSESVTGLSIFFFLLLFFSLLWIIKAPSVSLKLVSFVIFFTVAFFGFFYIYNTVKVHYKEITYDFSELKSHSPYGNPYYHDTTTVQSENGHLIWVYVCYPELEIAWEKHSNYSFYGEDDKGQYLPATLISYMASKGLRKDFDGFKSMTDKDIRAVEKGIPNVSFFERASIKKRIHQILYEYDVYKTTGDANGLSVMMRIEFAKAALGIIKKNFVFGVGTGDVNIAFKKRYEEMNSLLEPHFRWRAHNQYLSIFVAFGLLGFLVFILALVYPGIKQKRFTDYRYLAFFIVVVLSMLTEDTLETQAGVTFFSFFSVLFLLAFGDKTENKDVN